MDLHARPYGQQERAKQLEHRAPARACSWSFSPPAALIPFAASIGTSDIVLIVLGISMLWGALLLFVQARAAAAARRLRADRDALEGRAEEARKLAEQDALTGLGNYRMFWQRVEAEAARARRHDTTFSLVMIDLDGFKGINDELGHQAGDEALRQVARALREQLRAEDVVCRQGGDEFAVIGVEAWPERARELAERLVNAIAATSRSAGFGDRLSACAGWAAFGEHASTVEDLVMRCDEALRFAKSVRRPSTVAGPGDADRPPGEQLRTLALQPTEGVETSRLAVLGALARELAGASDDRRVVEVTVDHVREAIRGSDTSAVRYDQSRGRLEMAALGGWVDVEVPGRRGRGDLGIFEPVVRGGAALMLSDVREDPRGEALTRKTPSLRSLMIVPVLVNEEAWGALSLESEAVHAFDSADRDLVEAMAAEAARALSCVWAFAELAAGGGEDTNAHRLAAAVEGSEEECWRVADLAWRVGRAMDLERDDLRALYLGALFHDVGVLGVPNTVLTKPGRLSARERELLNQHPVIGELILRPLPQLSGAAPVVRNEHERYDGTGYPDGLSGSDIPLASRILFACDAYVAMTSERAWREAMSQADALAELGREAGAQFDPDVIEFLLGELANGVEVSAPA